MRYLLFSSNPKGHGIHSPFIYDLVTKVFRNKTDASVVLKIEEIRKKNLRNKRRIEVLDLGAGSEKMKDNRRSVSEITGNSAVPQKYGRLLLNLASYFGKRSVIEFGTSVGISTLYLSAGCRSIVHTMEGCPGTAETALLNFREAGTDNIVLHIGDFDAILDSVVKDSPKPGLIFIDGNHRKEPLLSYFCRMSEIADEETVIVVDDIHSSDGMEEAWESIKKHSGISATVDIFRMGIVFFRKGMMRRDYVIRY